MKQCSGPCTGNITKEEYRERVDKALEFLNGNYGLIIKELEQKMNDASEELDFESAAKYRDLLASVRVVAQKQKMTDSSMEDKDHAVKAGREFVCQKDLMEAFEQVVAGKEKKDSILSKEERKVVSYHEVGHALVSAVLSNTEPVQKITIVPRTKGSLGYVLHLPEDEKNLRTKDELIEQIIVSLGGRAAEELVFNTVTTGAGQDIEDATSIARSMITLYGMSDRFGLMQLESIQNRYLDGNRVLQCSDETATQIDEEIKALLAECYAKSKEILSEHLDTLDKIAEFLIEKETITGKEFIKIYREAEGLPEPEEGDEPAMRKRIYATRPESVMIGENVPLRENKKNDSSDSKDSAKEAEDVKGITLSKEADAKETESKEAEVKEAPAPEAEQENKDENTTQEKTSGGRFSHVSLLRILVESSMQSLMVM